MSCGWPRKTEPASASNHSISGNAELLPNGRSRTVALVMEAKKLISIGGPTAALPQSADDLRNTLMRDPTHFGDVLEQHAFGAHITGVVMPMPAHGRFSSQFASNSVQSSGAKLMRLALFSSQMRMAAIGMMAMGQMLAM